MYTTDLKRWAFLVTSCVALVLSPVRAGDQTVSGNLTVTGTSDLQGNTLAFGIHSDSSDLGALTVYTDGTISTVEFDASRSANIWKWQQNWGAILQVQMSLNLNNNNELVLYNQASTPVPKITLNPLGTSTFANSITINGTDNEMANQTLVNASSVLTEGLADSRYLSSGATTLIFGAGSSATGTNSVALGSSAVASGNYSFAGGFASTASGTYSIAMGNSTIAPALGELALGQFNVGGFGTGGDTAWLSTDPLLELGNGTDAAHPHDALLVDKAGNVTAGGVITAQPGGDIPMYSGN